MSTARERCEKSIESLLRLELIKFSSGSAYLFTVTSPEGIHVYKKVNTEPAGWGTFVMDLTLEKGTQFVARHSFEGKCRANAALVRHDNLQVGYSDYFPGFSYFPGRRVIPSSFSPEAYVCAPGIHFFMTRHDAEIYQF